MRLVAHALAASFVLTTAARAQGAPSPGATDSLDAFIRTQITQRKVPGLSLAIIDGGKIAYARGYGVTAPGGKDPVTPETVFLAGSVSKSVAAMGALKLVEEGKLSLDGDVNDKLTTWKVPENQFTAQQKVTIGRIVSHTAGLTVHGFAGYDRSSSVPTLPQILDGASPANSPPVRVDTFPGARWKYSGGGYTIMQLLMEDVTGQPFARWMQANVLEPFGMSSSTFDNPLPRAMWSRAAAGTYPGSTPVPGGWHVYPEMAAAGLWTTASDLARFAIGVEQSFAGTKNPVISQEMTQRMLRNVMNNDGLGVFLEGRGPTLKFLHGGRDEGFDTYMGAFAERGQGVIIMINANDNSGMMRRIVDFIGRRYGWPDISPAIVATRVSMGAATLRSFAGRYEASNNNMLTLAMEGSQLVSLADGLTDRVWVPTGALQVTSEDGDRQFTFVQDGAGHVTGFTRSIDGKNVVAPRIGPLLEGARPERDPDPARTQRVEGALLALSRGGTEVTSSRDLPAGTKAELGVEPVRALRGFSGVTFILEEDVSGRGIERHGSPIAKVLHYRLKTPSEGKFVLVHLRADGMIADYDVVVN